jgi:hypothetical protein
VAKLLHSSGCLFLIWKQLLLCHIHLPCFHILWYPGGAAVEEAPVAAAPTEGARPASRRKSAGVKLPAVAVEQVDQPALVKLKLGKAEQFIFVISQVRACFSAVFIDSRDVASPLL